MRLTKLSIANFRSIKKAEGIRIEALQAFVGENNAGKSNILRALNAFLSSGSGAVEKADFNQTNEKITIEAEFSALSATERKRLRPYLVGDRLTLRKEFAIGVDSKTGKEKVHSEFHGYKAEPKDWWLSIQKINAQEGTKPKWATIAEQHGILDYVKTADGKVTKASYEAGLERLLAEKDDVEYDEPTLGQTQALGFQANLVGALPEFFLLPAITDYSDEIDRRTSSTVFRRLMGELSDRLIVADPRYAQVESAIQTIAALLNSGTPGTPNARLDSLGGMETLLCDTIKKLMPSVRSVRIGVDVDQPREIFAKGVTLKIDDGVMTDVIDKGNGMQRSVIFSMLQLLMKSSREKSKDRPIILGIEEPELYIHPQSQRLIFRVLKDFAGIQDDDAEPTGIDQVLYTTHAPAFIDVGRYEQIACVRKPSTTGGTTIHQCSAAVLGTIEDRKGFKLLTSFGLEHNELFFARHCILVEGAEDQIAVIATGRKLKKFSALPDEIQVTVLAVGGKGELPKFQKILNAFGLPYSVLLELDGKDESDKDNKAILDIANGKLLCKIPKRLEDLTTLNRHFKDEFEAKQYFSKPENITTDIEIMLGALFPALEAEPVTPVVAAAAVAPTAQR